jgi:hypothetical protein
VVVVSLTTLLALAWHPTTLSMFSTSNFELINIQVFSYLRQHTIVLVCSIGPQLHMPSCRSFRRSPHTLLSQP